MSVQFGLAIENFAPAARGPDIDRIAEYARVAEAHGFESLWAWDHILLGSARPFPVLESLTTLAALARETSTVTLGTGILVLPLRNPSVLAKVTSTLDVISGGRLVLGVASGWYEREFAACGVPHKGRGAVFERNLEVLMRLWTDEEVSGSYGEMEFRRARMLPRPISKPRPGLLVGGYVDRVLRRVGERSDGWLTYFYRPESFARAWRKVQDFAAEAGREPGELTNVAQLPICVADSYEEADRRSKEFIGDYFDLPEWSESSAESAIRGRPDQCVEQLAEHIEAGVEHVVLAPYGYELDQVKTIATEIIPRLNPRESA